MQYLITMIQPQSHLMPLLAVAELGLINEAVDQMMDVGAVLEKAAIFNLNHISVWPYDNFWEFFSYEVAETFSRIMDSDAVREVVQETRRQMVIDYPWDLVELLRALQGEGEFGRLESLHLEVRVHPEDFKPQHIQFHGYFRDDSMYEIMIPFGDFYLLGREFDVVSPKDIQKDFAKEALDC